MKKIKLSLCFLSIFFLVTCLFIFKGKKNTDLETNITDSAIMSELNYYIYIDNNNNLITKNITNHNCNIISDEVLEFDSYGKYIAYISKEYVTKKLNLYSFETNTSFVLKDNYTNDFYLYEDCLYYLDGNSICSYNITTQQTSILLNLNNSDIIFNCINNDNIIFSGLLNNIPTTQQFNFTTKQVKTLFINASNVVPLGDFIYALDSSLNLFRYNEFVGIETISDFMILKFFIQDDYIIYIDNLGRLNTLTMNGINRVIADSVSNFIVKNEYIYYTSPSAKNKIIKIHLSGRNKEFIINNANDTLNFNEINYN